jgi:hypothetical protein
MFALLPKADMVQNESPCQLRVPKADLCAAAINARLRIGVTRQ